MSASDFDAAVANGGTGESLMDQCRAAIVDCLKASADAELAAVRADERGRCVKVAEACDCGSSSPGPLFYCGWSAARAAIVDDILAMGDTK